MTKEDTRHCIRIMRAYVNGEEIEYCNDGEDVAEWTTTASPVWEWNSCDYRVKPGTAPYDFEDFIRWMTLNNQLWVKSKANGNIYAINMVNKKGVHVDRFMPFEELLEKFTHIDGTPCGK